MQGYSGKRLILGSPRFLGQCPFLKLQSDYWHRAGMDKSKLGRGPKAAPTKVAEECYEAMKAEKDRVVASKPDSKFIGNIVNNLLPDTVTASLHAKGARPGSGLEHQDD